MDRVASKKFYMALYERGDRARDPGCNGRYHWALLLGPKPEDADACGKRYHAKETTALVEGRTQSVWRFEEHAFSMAHPPKAIVRILIGKVKNQDRLEAVLRNVPVRNPMYGLGGVLWVRGALKALAYWQEDGAELFQPSACELGWAVVRKTALLYVHMKDLQHRFGGLAEESRFKKDKVPTWDILKAEEMAP